MIKPHSPRTRKHEIDLSGPEGNAFVLLGYAKRLAHQIGIDPEPILIDMTSSDYEHLIQVFDKNFGQVIDLVRPPEEA